MERGETSKGFCWRNLRERDHLGDPSVDGRIILRCIFRKFIERKRLQWYGHVKRMQDERLPKLIME